MLSRANTIEVTPAARLSENAWEQWQAANDAWNDGHPALDADFVSALVDIADPQRLVLATARNHDVPVLKMLMYRKPWGACDLFSPPQAPYGAILISPEALAHEAGVLRTIFMALPRTALALRLYRQHARTALGALLAQTSRGIEADSRISTVVKLDGSFQDYWSAEQRPAKQMRRKLQALTKAGLDCKLHIVTQTSELERALLEHAELEATGWKGAEGSAIDPNQRSGRFYRTILSRFAAKGAARVFQLRTPERLLASQIALDRSGTIALLKTAYDEQLSSYSPGRVLDYRMLEHLFNERDGDVVDFCNDASAEDERWATSVYRLWSFTLFRSELTRRSIRFAKALTRKRA